MKLNEQQHALLPFFSKHAHFTFRCKGKYGQQVIAELLSMAGPGQPHEHTLLMVFGDHGQTLTGDHGGGALEEVDSALLAVNMGAYHQIRWVYMEVSLYVSVASAQERCCC